MAIALGILAIIAVICLNVWDRKRKAKLTPEQRAAEDKEAEEFSREW